MRGEEDSPIRGYASLRQFRDSKPGADYFLTTNLQNRGRGLASAEMTTQIRRQWEKLESEGWWTVRTATVMPDHVHWLATLTGHESLTECVWTFKGRLAPVLRRQNLYWQDGFYDHRLRTPADLLPVFLYIFLNPYRAGLIGPAERWPGYYCSQSDWSWFRGLTRESRPEPDWLR